MSPHGSTPEDRRDVIANPSKIASPIAIGHATAAREKVTRSPGPAEGRGRAMLSVLRTIFRTSPPHPASGAFLESGFAPQLFPSEGHRRMDSRTSGEWGARGASRNLGGMAVDSVSFASASRAWSKADLALMIPATRAAARAALVALQDRGVAGERVWRACVGSRSR
jgi:hypothetical protein